MKVLIIGNGGREHIIAKSTLKSAKVSKIFVAPGNAGTALLEKTTNVNLTSIEDLLAFALQEQVDLTIVGPETLLVEGIVDIFKANQLQIIGADKRAAALEGSKAFAKDFMQKYGVKTASYANFTQIDLALEYLETQKYPLVVKASGLAGGKGVIICEDKEQAQQAVKSIMADKIFANSGNEIVIEQFLCGVEASILSIYDGKQIVTFQSAKDHKKIYEKETGQNTGGMGVISPNPYVTSEVNTAFIEDILQPTLKGIQAEKLDFVGFIFFGLMICEDGVYLLEYNMRLGDPETQAVLSLLETDFIEVIENALEHNLSNFPIQWKAQHSCVVVLVSLGYPNSYDKGFVITGLDTFTDYAVAGAILAENNEVLTTGGRVINIIGFGNSLDLAIQDAYAKVDLVNFTNKSYRKDIGTLYE